MQTKLKPVDVKFTNLSFLVPIPKTKDKKHILNSINGTFKSGQLTAIMGPSGCGKTSLLNILTGLLKQGVSGEVTTTRSENCRKLCSYILQDDYLFPWFTVEETMILAATLKISGKSMSFNDRQLLIETVLESLHLQNNKDTKCSSLSGGQKKRLSIALELLDNPPILLLDEPTTGLDSSSTAYCVQLLQDLAKEGRTIICTIHQPSAPVYHLLDHVYALSNGHCVYQGSPKNTIAYLKQVGLECPSYHNPSDYLLEVITGEHGNHIDILTENAKDEKWRYDQGAVMVSKEVAQLQRTSSRRFSSENTQHTYPPPEWIKLWILIGRCHVQFYRDWTVTHLKLALHILCAILMSFLFGDSGQNATKAISNIGLFMIGIVYLWYTTVMPGVLRFPLEIATIRKETFNNWYKLRTYYIACLITSTPVHILFASVFSTILYFMTSQPFEIIRYAKFVFSLIVTTITADAFGVLLGTVFNTVNGTFLGAVCTCFMLIYGGFLVLYDHMPKFMKIFGYLSCHKFALESMVISVYDEDRADLTCPDTEMYCHLRKPSLLLKSLGMNTAHYAFDVLMILLQLSVFKFVSYFTLKRALKNI